MYLPYQGAIVASSRSADYLRFLGIPAERIMLGAYTTSNERVRRDAGLPPAPEGASFQERYFLCVARMVEKKNHLMLLEAYARYRSAVANPRSLVLCGTGPLEPAVRARVVELGLDHCVTMAGNIPAEAVALHLANALCLVLTSIEEQFGIVVLEAQAMGLPTLLTVQCGARDTQVRTSVNGFIVEEDNPEGLSYFMARVGEDEQLWRHMAEQAQAAAARSDTAAFVTSALAFVEASSAAYSRAAAPASSAFASETSGNLH